MKRKRRKDTPLLLFWSRSEQKRFIDAVERLVSVVNDLRADQLAQQEERSERARRANRTRQARQVPAACPTDAVDALNLPETPSDDF